MSKSIKLISFDLDGTFLNDSKQVPERNTLAIEKAAAQGVHIVPATGRTYAGLPDMLKELPFIRYYITANGSCIYDKKEDKALSRSMIPLELALRFYEHMETLPVIYDCYKEESGYMSRYMWEQLEDYISNPHMLSHVKSMRRPVDDLVSHLIESGEELLKMQMFFKDQAERERQLELLPRRFPELVFSSSIPGNIEVTIQGGTKGNALKKLCELLGLDISQSMALGDGSNDRDMIKAAGIGVAMENAEAVLLSTADYVTGHCNDAGFAQAIEKFVFSE
ncbi:MAG: HAD family phosphatase [Oscillospiraceae bacterium]|nr:HAD family phosphatase [Oscillospiraceae bacterium]